MTQNKSDKSVTDSFIVTDCDRQPIRMAKNPGCQLCKCGTGSWHYCDRKLGKDVTDCDRL